MESIQQAALGIVERYGFEYLTTTKLAERVGISIGSFYEYFPNKEAVLLSLFESASTDAANKVRELMPEMFELPIEQSIPLALKTLYEVHANNRLVLIDLFVKVPELQKTVLPITYDSLIQGVARAYIDFLGVKLSPREMQHTKFFMNHMVMGSVRHYITSNPTFMSPEEFIDNLSEIIINYIQGVLIPKTHSG
ncbi:MAG: TetR/AcrR family transcriptional regulator [Porticoccaceae bacterium]